MPDTKEKKKVKCNFPPAPQGNKLATKLKDPDIRQEAFRQYCDHIASGLPKEAFFFDHPTHSVCWKTMERYINESPSEFPSFKIEAAKSTRFKVWLGHGEQLMRGKYRGGSPVVWQTMMRNLFREQNWDREQIAQDSKTHVERLAANIRGDAVTEAENGDSKE